MTVSSDVIVVGAGVAGASVATVLSRKGFSVILIDPRPECETPFRAEKVAQDQVQVARELGLLEPILPVAGHIRTIRAVYNGRVFRTISTEQYGIAYPDLVNAMRAQLPKEVGFKLGYVRRIRNSAQTQTVLLDGGEELTSRLVVLASGLNPRIQESLGIARRMLQKDHCSVLGFTIAPLKGSAFDFDGVTCYPTTAADGIDYFALFRFRDSMRGNLFVFRSRTDPWIQRFRQAPKEMIQKAFPKLQRIIGEYRVAGQVDFGSVNLYCSDGNPQPGIIGIGDTFQSACPAVGLGMYKVFTDIKVLSECMSGWWATPGMGSEKLRQYYDHPLKRSVEEMTIESAFRQRNSVVNPSLSWRLRRLRYHLKMRLGIA